MNRRQYLQWLLASGCLASQTSPQAAIAIGAASHEANNGSSPEDWPDFLGPNRNGISTEIVEIRDWTKLPLVWQVPLGEGYTIGSCRGESFIQIDRVGDQERTQCLSTATGQVLWVQQRPTVYQDMYGYDGGPRCSPVLANDAIYTYGVDGVLIARNAQDGKLLWERHLNRDYHVVQNFFGVGSTPIMHGDRLWVMVGGSPEADLKIPPGDLNRVSPSGTAMVALDCRSGKTILEVGDDLASYSSPVLATLHPRPNSVDPSRQTPPGNSGVTVLLAWCRAGLLCLDPNTGKQHFHFPFRSSLMESVNAATPVVVGNQVLLSETYSVGSVLLELDPDRLDRPQVVWQDEPKARDQSLQCHWNTPVYHDGHIYASSGRNTGNAELRCVQWATGKVVWKQPGLTRCSLTKAGDDDLIVMSERGELFLIRATPDGFQRLTTHRFARPEMGMRYPAWAGAALAQGKMFCRDKSTLYCFQVVP